MDKLQRKIEDLLQEATTCERDGQKLIEEGKLKRLKAEHMAEAAQLRPLATEEAVMSDEKVAARRGKKPGSVSRHWSGSLGLLYGEQSESHRHSLEEIKASYAAVSGKELDISSVRDRIRYFQAQEPPLMEGDYDKGFLVTEAAANKFGFEKNADASANGFTHGQNDNQEEAGMFN